MGIKRSPSYRDYWSTNFQMNDPYVSSIMPVKRFSSLLSNLHLNDNSQKRPRGDPNFDKLYKVRPLLDNLSGTLKNLYGADRHQAIDESMIRFKGKNSIKQYLPKKPIKRGYKVWVRAEKSGYVCEFQIYTGKVNDKSEKFHGERVVKDLTHDLIGKYYRVFFYNYFTNVTLMSDLLCLKILSCGTVRKDRKYFPKLQKKEKKNVSW